MKRLFKTTILILSILISGCGGGSGGSNEDVTKPVHQDKQERVTLSANDLSLTFSEYGIAYPQVSDFYGILTYQIADGAAEDVVWVDPYTGEMRLLAAGETQVLVEDKSSYYRTSSTIFTVTVDQTDNSDFNVSTVDLPTIESNKMFLPIQGNKGELSYTFEPEGMVNFDEETGHIWSTGTPGEVEVTVIDSGDRNYRSKSVTALLAIDAVDPNTLMYSYIDRTFKEGMTLSPIKVSGTDSGTYYFELDDKDSDVLTIGETNGLMTVNKTGAVRIKVTQQLGAEYGDVEQTAYFTVQIMKGERPELSIADSELAYLKDFLYQPAVNNNIAAVRFEVIYGENVVKVDEQTGLVRIINAGYAELKATDDQNDNYYPSEKWFSITVVPAVHPGLKNQTDTYTYSEGLIVTPEMEGQLGRLAITGDTDVLSLSGNKFTVLKAGTANLSVYDDGGDNYLASSPTSLKVTVLKAAHPDFTAEDITTTYFPDYCVQANISGTVGAINVTPITSSDNEIAEYNAADQCFMVKRSGTASFDVVRAESENYQASSSKRLNVIINPADSRLHANGNVYRPYSEEETIIQPPTIGGGTGHLSFDIVDDQSDSNVITIDRLTGEMTLVNVGSAIVQVTDAGNEQYEPASTHFTVTIDKAYNPVLVSYPHTEYLVGGVISPVIEDAKGQISYRLQNVQTSPVTLDVNGALNIRSTGEFTVEVTAEETAHYKQRTFEVSAFVRKTERPEVEIVRAAYAYEPFKKVILDYSESYGSRTYSTYDNGDIAVNPNTGEFTILDYLAVQKSDIYITEEQSELYYDLPLALAGVVKITPPVEGSATRDLTLTPVFRPVESSVDYVKRPYEKTAISFAGTKVLQPTDEELQKYGKGIALSVGMQSVDNVSDIGRKIDADVRVYVQRYEGCSTSVNTANLPNLGKEKKASSFDTGDYCSLGRPTSRFITYTVVDKSALDKFSFYDGEWETRQPFVTYRTSEDYASSHSQSDVTPTELLEWDRIELKMTKD
ncbi:cadherin repeat domain-containing protein [Photobacterium minamisatsumaniensis]|uniref:cadherin repeat domain-containing protein n=1 Tax=Photobacterium minamisatsumaniensis TaxID=2910233 RepID=UPI003D0C7A9A